MAKKIEIGLQNRETGKYCFVPLEDTEEQIYMSIGHSVDDEGEICDGIYAFESNMLLFNLPAGSSNKKIDREFLKRYKLIRPNACKRLRKEGVEPDCELV